MTSVPKSGGFRVMLSQPIVHVIFLIALGFITYINTCGAPFTFDDTIIQNSLAIRDPRYFTDRELQEKALFKRELDEHFRSRIVGHLTFALNYKLHGLRVTGYHLFNMAAHLANSVLVYLLVLLTIRTPWFRKTSGDTENPYSYRMAALFAALLFVSHPVQTGAVIYITQRVTVLAAMFCLLSLVFYIKARFEADARVRFFSASTLTFYLISLFSAVLAMKTKQISFTLPVVIALYEAMFFEGNARRRLLYLVPLLLTMLIVPLTVLTDRIVLTDIMRLEASINGAHGVNEAADYFLTQFRVIVTYLRLLILPINQNLDYDYPIYRSFFKPAVFLSFMFLAGIFMTAVCLYRRSRKEGSGMHWQRLTAFGIFWFFITLSVESSIIPLADVIFEHRLYLPSAGFFMAVVSVTATARSKFGKTGSRAITLSLTLAVVMLSAATFQRSKIWGDNIRLWEDTTKKSPYKARPHYNLGLAYEKRGLYDMAINEYMAILRIDPEYANVYSKHGVADEYLAALKSGPGRDDIHVGLGVAFNRQGQTDEAVKEFMTALRINPDSADAHYGLGVTYESRGRIDEAIAEYLAALRINPNDIDARVNLGVMYGNQGQTDKAVNELTSALKVKPDSADAHYNLGIVYERQGRIDEAIAEYLAALRINPADPDARVNLGVAYGKQGHADKAINELTAALKIKPDSADAHNDLGIAYAMAGRKKEAAYEFKEALRLNPQDINARKNLEKLLR